MALWNLSDECQQDKVQQRCIKISELEQAAAEPLIFHKSFNI